MRKLLRQEMKLCELLIEKNNNDQNALKKIRFFD